MALLVNINAGKGTALEGHLVDVHLSIFKAGPTHPPVPCNQKDTGHRTEHTSWHHAQVDRPNADR